MKCRLIILATLMFSQFIWAQNSTETLNALREGRSSWANQDDNTSSSQNSSVDFESSTAASVACSKEDQNSIPLKFFASLLSKDIEVKQDASVGSLTLDGGKMIGNCNSMLKYNFSKPQDGRPYLFQVEIRRPASCSGSECNYNVSLADDPDNPQIQTKVEQMKFEPTYYGFLKCLEASGVIKDGAFQANKIITAPFKYSENGMISTDEVLFYSKGPEGPKMGPHFNAKASLNGKSCGFYEAMTKDGFSYTSIEDIREEDAQDLFQKICSRGDYRLIDSHLPEFKEFSIMYDILRQVRNQYLLDEVKLLHEQLKKKDYSELNAQKYRDTIEDFYQKIIIPLKAKIAYKVKKIDETPSGSRRDELKEELELLTNKLITLNKAPYLNAEDYEKMKDFARKAPLEKQEWRDGALALYKSNNTAYHYSRYNDKIRESNDDLEIVSVRTADIYIGNDVDEQREELYNLGRLANDKDLSIAKEFVDRAQTVKKSQKYNIQASQQFIREEQMYAQNHCLNPRKYWINRQKCLRGVQENIHYSQTSTQQFNQSLNPAIDQFMQQANRWAQIEAMRNGGAAPNLNPTGQQNLPGNGQYIYDFNNPNGMNRDFSTVYSNDPRFNFSQPRQPGLSTPGFTPGYSNGFQGSGYWGAGFGRNPAAANGYWGYNQQGQIPPAMNYHSNSMYGGGGANTFSFNP